MNKIDDLMLEELSQQFVVDGVTFNNTTALLEELIANGKESAGSLFAWFLGEREFIEVTLKDLNDIEPEKDE